MKKYLYVFGVLATFALASLADAAQVTIYNVSWKSRWPWNGLVDITYYVACENPDAQVLVLLSGHDNDRDVNVPITVLLGPGITEPVKEGGPYTVTWYVAEDEPDLNFSSFTITMGGMIQNNADILKDTYAVTCEGCVADVEKAAKDDDVTVTAVLPEGMEEAEAVVAWSFSPSMEFMVDGLTATFTMPAEAVAATAKVKARTYKLTCVDCAADVAKAAKGEAVTVTAELPAGLKEADAVVAWSFSPEVEFMVDGFSATFTMPAEAVTATAKVKARTYKLTCVGCAADVAKAAKGEEVTVTAVLPEGMDEADVAGVAWSFSQSVEFTQDGLTATFTMPNMAVEAKAKVKVLINKVTSEGCVANVEKAAKGDEVTVRAVLPEGLEEDQVYDVAWYFSPSVEFRKDGVTATFTMPDEAVDVEAKIIYIVYSYNCTSSTDEAVKGDLVAVSAELPEYLKESYKIIWSFSPKVEFTEDGLTATFTMPEMNVSAMRVTARVAPKAYLVIDLSGGTEAERFPYRYTDEPPDVSDDKCRTTELWLRCIYRDTFTMGSPEGEMGRDASKETQHKVSLGSDYFIGVFECTQRQYELVTGEKPSYFNNAECYATRPVEYVSYDMLRGKGTEASAGWPDSGHTVDGASFMGILQAKTGLLFDLPTEAQWEYACRAGTSTALNSGEDLDSAEQDANMDAVGRNKYNGGSGYSSNSADDKGTAKAGSYLPNAWGLYDMHGNVSEWCLDWWQDDLGGSAVTDPVGATEGTSRVIRGGSFYYGAQFGRSAYRINHTPRNGALDIGFRCAVHPPSSYAISVSGAFCDYSEAAPGDDVSVYVILPPGLASYEFTGATWSFSPKVEFWQYEYGASFTMPASPVEVTATINFSRPENTYLVIDLSGGTEADNFPYRFTGELPDWSDDKCRTTELWLRRIPKGTFNMRDFLGENEWNPDHTEPWHEVTLTQDFYIGVFECTQRQYELVTGARPSYFSNEDDYATRPVENLYYNEIRGRVQEDESNDYDPSTCGWPMHEHGVTPSSFFGILQRKTGLTFDLPTEAQWEYACRSGWYRFPLNTGVTLDNEDQDPHMDKAGRYRYNGGYSSGTAKVGSYLPSNEWGLYDMHGNVWEMCLDLWQKDLGTTAVINPKGPYPTDENYPWFRVVRGGSWNSNAKECRSASRSYIVQDGEDYHSSPINLNCVGFRVAVHGL